MKFLIIDDNPADRELTIRKLRLAFEEAEFTEVADASDFADVLSCGDFDFVLSDYHLRWSDGLSVFETIKARFPDVPVVMFTDSGNEDVAVQGMKAGLSDYLLKRHMDRLPYSIKESMEKTALQRKYEETARRLRLSEERYRMISEMTSDYAYAFRVEPDGSAVGEWVTEAFYRITGYTREEVAERGGWMCVLHPEDVSVVEGRRDRLLTGKTTVLEYRIRTREGEERWLRDISRPVWDDEAGRVTRVFGAAQDVTRQRRAEAALRESEQKYRSFFEQSSEGVILVDDASAIVEWNQGAEAIFGIPREEALGEPLWDVQFRVAPAEERHPENHARLREWLQRQFEAHEFPVTQTDSRPIRRLGGDLRYVQSTVFPIHVNGKFMVGSIVRDVTAQREAREALHRAHSELEARVEERTYELAEANEELQVIQEELRLQNEELVEATKVARAERQRYQELFEFAPDGYLVTDVEGYVLEANRAALDLLQTTADLVLGRTLLIHVSAGLNVLRRALYRLQRGEIDRAENLELRVAPPDATAFYAAVNLLAVRDKQNRLEGIRWSVRDVTARKEAAEEREQLLEEVQEQRLMAEAAARETLRANNLLRALIDTLPAGVVVTNAQGETLLANAAANALTNGAVRGFTGRPTEHYTLCALDGDPLAAEELPLHRAGQDEIVHNEELLVRWSHGNEQTYMVSAAPVREDDAGEVVSVVQIFQDITERKRAQLVREHLLAQVTQDRELIRELASVLERERQILQIIMEHTPVHLAYMDETFNFVRANSAYVRNTDYSEAELVGHNHFEFFPDEELEAEFARVKETGVPLSSTASPFPIEGKMAYWDWSLVPVVDWEGELQGFVLSLLDVTEREQAKQAQEIYLDRLQRLLEVSKEILAERFVDGVLRRVVDAARTLTGARIGTSGHGYVNGEFLVGASSQAEGTTPCPPGECFKIERGGVYMELIEKGTPLRLNGAALHEHPAWWGLPEGHASLNGLLGVPLLDSIGDAHGLIMVSDKPHGEFTATDEALLTQLATIASLGLRHITARSEAERRADERAAILSSMAEALVVFDVQGVSVLANPAAQETYGLDPVGRSSEELIEALRLRDMDGNPVAAKELPSAQALKGQAVRGKRFRIRHSNGKGCSILASAAPIWRNGDVGGAVVTWQDISEREQLLTQLADERARLRALIENAPGGIVMADEKGRVVLTNPAANRLYARPVPYGQAFESHASLELCYPDGTPYAPRNLPLTRAALDGKNYTNVEMQIVWPDGQRRALLTNAAPIRDAQGTVKGAVTVFQDITERKQIQEALQRYANRLQVLQETDRAILAARSAGELATAGLFYLRQLIACPRADVLIYDREADEMYLLAVHGEKETAFNQGWRNELIVNSAYEELSRGRTYITEDLHKEAPGNPVAQGLRDEGVRAYLSVPLIAQGQLIGALNLGWDQPRRPTPEELEIAHELADQLTLGIHQARLHAEVQRHADELEKKVTRRTASLRASEARFRAIFEDAAVGIALVSHEGTLMQSNPALKEMLGYEDDELDGMHFEAITYPDDVEADRTLFAEMAQGQRDDYQVEKRYVRKDGDILWGNLVVSLIRDAQGDPQFTIGMVEDITARKQAEAALIRSEKLAITGKLAASMAHEINNPLQSVIGCLGLADETIHEGGDITRYLTVAREELHRAARIVTQLRDLNRKPLEEQRNLTDVNELLERVLVLSRKQLESQHVQLLWDPYQSTPKIRVVPDQIQQVFLNLVLNAIDAMPEGGDLHITTSASKGPKTGLAVSFADSGMGMTDEILANIFSPFYSTKSDGMGLGLFISHDIIKQHGGRIDVKSETGKGTTFTVWLPLAAEKRKETVAGEIEDETRE